MADRATERIGDNAQGPRADRENDLERVVEALRGLRFGEVRAIVHDGVIVQIERLEKTRLR